MLLAESSYQVTMSIQELLANYEHSLKVELKHKNLPNRLYSPDAHYAAMDNTSFWLNQMLNHKDWTIELQDKHYPTQKGSIPYPVSC